MSRSRTIALLSLLTASVLAAGFRNIPYLTAEEIMTKVKDTHAATSEIDHVRMVTLSDAGQATNRELISVVQTDPKGNHKYLLRFLEPKEERGSALLVVETGNGDSEQWLYLSSLKQARQIQSTQRAGKFMDSDFTYEDMRKEKPNEWTYNRLQDEKLDDGTDCYSILSAPVDKKREAITGYANRVMDIDKSTFDIRRIEFFDSKNNLIKSFDAREYKTADGKTQRPRQVIMKSKNSTTVMTLLNSSINKPIDEKLFSIETIKNWGPDQDKIIADALPNAPAPAK